MQTDIQPAEKLELDNVRRNGHTRNMREITLQTRVTRAQRALIRKAARAAGQSVSFYIAESIMEQVKRETFPLSEKMREEINADLNRLLRVMIEEEKESA